MHVVFAMAADGRAYPEHPGDEAGCVGGAVVGPAGLLDLLATRLGLGGPRVPPVVRVATWQRKLEEAGRTGPRFWAASLAADAWATARELLRWRDALVEAGWSPSALADPPARLADLAAAELAGPALPRGRADMLREITAAVKAGEPVGVDLLELADGAEHLAPGWHRLVRALEEAGTCVRPIARFAPVDVASDIGRLHVFLRTGSRTPLGGDGTVCEINAVTATAAAECVAEWLASDDDAGGGAGAGETVVIAPDGDSFLLDQALGRRGLPALGLSPASSHRGALQVLSLAFSVAWAPVDPATLLELLLLPHSPMPRWAADILARALAEEPGIDGPAWRAAWERIRRRLNGAAAMAVGDAPDADATLARWRAWVDAGRHDRRRGMPTPDAVAICRRVHRWAVEREAGERDPLLLCVADAAQALVTALDTLSRPSVTALLLDRMIDQAIAEGARDPSREAQAGRLRAVGSPGALWGAAHRVIWWGFSAPTRSAPRPPWSARERAALEAAGCCPEPPAAATRREASQCQAALLNARSLILVRPALDRGAEPAPHPFAQRLGPLLAQAGNAAAVRFAAERLLAEERVPLAARELVRTEAVAAGLPVAEPSWALPPTLAARAGSPARRESATSLTDLLGCQFRWVLKHVAGLKRGATRDVPGAERLLGNLAHALAREAFLRGEVPDPHAVQRRAVAGLDRLLARIAAPLLLPGLAGELAFARRRIPEALAALAADLARGGFTVEGVEVEHERDVGGFGVMGRIDLVVRGPDGGRAVVDLKWTARGGEARRAELADGRAVQLATYSRLLEPDGPAPPAGYYLLRQRRLLAEAGSPLASDEIRVTRGLADTWDAVVEDSARLAALARHGTGVAAGVPGAEAHLPGGLAFATRAGVCASCDLTRLCRSATVE